MCTISDEVIKFITEDMKNWRTELTTGEKTLTEVKFQRIIIHADALSPLVFVIAMIPHNNKLRKFMESYKFTKSQENIQHFMYMKDIKLFAGNKIKEF